MATDDAPMSESLFVWRLISSERRTGAPPETAQSGADVLRRGHLHDVLAMGSEVDDVCGYCRTPLLYAEEAQLIQYYCRFCGFCRGSGFWGPPDIRHLFTREAILRSFDINAHELTFDELVTHLRRHYSDVSRLSPRRFEQLVAGIFRSQGFHVEMTQTTHDGGYDLVLLNDGQQPIIVEVKRYKGTVGVDIVRQLAGVQLISGFSEAILVTSGRFSHQATLAANSNPLAQAGKSIKLREAEELLRALDVYRDNASLPDQIRIRRQVLGLTDD